MRTFVHLKLINAALLWLENKSGQEFAGQSNTAPDFHDFLFSRLEKEFAFFDEPTREALFHLLHAGLEAWAEEEVHSRQTRRITPSLRGGGDIDASCAGRL